MTTAHDDGDEIILSNPGISEDAIDVTSTDLMKENNNNLELYSDDDTSVRTKLETELQKRRPDHFTIGVLCRSLGGIPTELRTVVWKELLGVARTECFHLDESISRVEEDLANQKVIAADAIRTRSHDVRFQSKEMVDTIIKLLTFYCKSRNIRYKQGMNEVLAPFLMLESDPPMVESVVFQCFYALIDKCLPHVFVDRDFKSLQCSFQLYRLLMLYHDPMLCNYLDQHTMTPELYVTPWFMTLFARNLAPELVFGLWDCFLMQEDPYLLHFVAYALVHSHREDIFAADVSNLPTVLSAITFSTLTEVQDICIEALRLLEITPRSFQRDLYSVCYGGYHNGMVPFLHQIMSVSSLQVYPDELVDNLLGRLGPHDLKSPNIIANSSRLGRLPSGSFSMERMAAQSHINFIILDCRPVEQYRECHLSLSYHVDPDVVSSPDALSVLLKGFERMKGCHFCFVGPSIASMKSKGSALMTRLTRGISIERMQSETSGDSSTSLGSTTNATQSTTAGGAGTAPVPRLHQEHITLTRLVLMFLQKGFEHISRLDGSFDDVRLVVDRMDTFAQEQLLVIPDIGVSESSHTVGVGSFKTFAKKALEKVRVGTDDNAVPIPPTSPTMTSTISTSAAGDAGTTIRAKTKATVSTLSLKIQNLTTAAKDVVGGSRGGGLTSPGAHHATVDGLVGDEEWMEVCVRTREALEKSLVFKDVVFQEGPLGILFKPTSHKKLHMIVDSLVPDSQASESQQIEVGDLLISINGEHLEMVPFQDCIEKIKDAQRPVVLRLQSTKKKKALESLDAIALPPLPPNVISTTYHSLSLSWPKLASSNTTMSIRYQLQYARQSEYMFNPWINVPIKVDGDTGVDKSGITTCNNGTIVGLDAGVSLVFRVRCGYGEKWGPYSLSSAPIATLDKSDIPTSNVDGVGDEEKPQTMTADSLSPRGANGTCRTAVFLPGECPEFFDRGVFYFKVIQGLRARATPSMDGDKLEDLILEKGMIVKCCERLVAPGTNQIYVRLCVDWNVAAALRIRNRNRLATTSNDDKLDSLPTTEPEFNAWAFENTPEGAIVLERLPEFSEETYVLPPLPLQEQAKSLVSSLLTGIKSGVHNENVNTADPTSVSTTTVTPSLPISAASPQILQVFAASCSEVVVTWDPVNVLGVTKYQLQYAKNRLASIWWSVKSEIRADTLKFTVNDLASNTAYMFRVRGGNDFGQWGPFSEPSEVCKTMEDEKKNEVSSEMDEKEGKRLPTLSTLFSTNSDKTTPPSTTTNNSDATSQVPVRTGSTLLDKAVAAASKLTLSRRRSTEQEPAVSVTMKNPAHALEGDVIDVVEWKAQLIEYDPSCRCFSAVRYVPMIASTTTSHDEFSTESTNDDDPACTTSNVLTWHRVSERDLVITSTQVFVVALPSISSIATINEAVIETCRPLSRLIKITSKKTVANSIVFHFKVDREQNAESNEIESSSSTEEFCFVVEDKVTCVALVKQNYEAARTQDAKVQEAMS